MSIRLAPSILSADFANLARDIAAVERGGADLIHVDVMDGHFVPNITIGPPVVRAIRRVARCRSTSISMIEDPDRYLDAFIDAGAAYLSVHVEVLPHLHRTIQAIKKRGVKAGVVLNPSTPVGSLENVAEDVDHVLVMSVNPGFGGQTFIPRSIEKIRAVRALLAAAGNAAPIEVDGGVDLTTVAEVVAAGADMLVAGNAIFGTHDPESAARTLRTVAVERSPAARRGHERAVRLMRSSVSGARSLRRDRQDGHRVLRQLPGVVRESLARIGCATRLDVPGDEGQDGYGAAGHRGTLRVQGQRAVR